MYVEELVVVSIVVAIMMFYLHFTDPPNKKKLTAKGDCR
jgi:hypothetical protein